MNTKKLLLTILISLSSLLFIATPVRGDTVDTQARVGFTKAVGPTPSGPTIPNLPGQSTSNPNVSTNTGNKVSNTNHYLPQTSESDSIWAPMLGVSMMTTLVTAYVFKNRQSKQL